MITYEEFKEERETSRSRLREYIQARTMDSSNRGSSTWQAYRRYKEMSGHHVNHEASVRDATFRFMWKSAYRMQRMRDRQFDAMMTRATRQLTPMLVKAIVNRPKIEDLLK